MKIKVLTSLLLALALTFSLVGCQTVVDDGSSAEIEYITEEEIVYVENENNSSDNSLTTTDQQANNNSQNENTDEDEAIGPQPKDYAGTTIKFAVTSDPANSEKGPVIENFEKQTGIKVEPVIIKGDFIAELTTLINNNESPDFVRSSGDFPLALSYLQSLDAAKIDYNDPIWEQGMFKMTTFNGSPYLCTTVGNVYTEADIVVYRKDILSAVGCKTPEQYDSEGNWNIDAFFDIARQCVQSTKVVGVEGCSFLNYDSAIHMTGNAVFKLENGKFVNGINDSAVDVMSKIYEAKDEGILSFGNSTNGIVNGTVAIATHHSYALRKTGAFENNEEVWNKLGYYYLPSFGESTKNMKTGIVRGWGIVRGAKNPVAAGVFLKYYLDSSHFDINDMYISPEAGTFFLKATDIDYGNWNPYFTYGNKAESIAEIDFYDDIYSYVHLSKSQIVTKLPSINSKIDGACKKMNSYVTQKTNEN